jgi:hypothetical protein
MDVETFNELALRAIAHEATVEDQAALAAEISANAERQKEFADFERLVHALRTTAPLTEAARAAAPDLPAYRLNELRTAVRQHFGPAVGRPRPANALLNGLRWLFAGGGLAGLATLIVLLCFSNRTIEVGSYADDLVRGGEHPLTQADLPAVQLITFDHDADFDAWQNRSLAWYEHAKIWVDNEHDQLHIVKRLGHGQVVMQTVPLATSDDAQAAQDAQRAQIRQAVDSLSR